VFEINPMNLALAIPAPGVARISFDTDVEGVAWIAYGEGFLLNSVAFDIRGVLTEDFAHEIDLIGLTPGQTVSFKIQFLGEIVGGVVYSFVAE
jgi:hypothetical protein